MVPSMVEMEADSDHFLESETMSCTTESSFQNQSGRNRGRTEAGKKVKKLRSIKLSRMPSRKGRSSCSQFHTMFSGYSASSEQSTSIELSDASPNHVNAATSSDLKENFRVLPVKLMRQSSGKPLMNLTRKPSMKFRRPQHSKPSGGTDLKKKVKKSRSSSENCCEVSSMSDPSVERATCSSTLKDSKFPNKVEIKAGGNESDGTAALNVCRYSYCSLHGHHHGNKSSLKRFVSIRRRAALTQKNLKPDHQFSGKAKRSGYKKKGLQTEKRGSNGDIGVAVIQRSVDISKTILGKKGKEGITNTKSTSNERILMNEEAHINVNEDIASSLNIEAYRGDSRKSVNSLENPSTGETCELQNVNFSLASLTGKTEEPTPASEEKNEDFEPAYSEAAGTNMTSKTEMENEKNFRFWKLIYQHMVTDPDAEFETQNPIPGVNSEEHIENISNAHENDYPCQQTSPKNKAISTEDHEARDQKLELSQSNVIQLVQQAFDKILSEIPDHSSDDQSIASEATSDQDSFLKKLDEGKESSISTSSNSTQDHTLEDQEQLKLQTDNDVACEKIKASQKEGKSFGKQMPNKWSNLKKIIILRRFVKSLEKVRSLKPRTPQYLPKHKDPEAEKIQLRHQNVNERKNSDEWMLDHALRQVISTLAPAQKRKVAMLVQAFETVTPLPENGRDMRSNAAASSPTTSLQGYEFTTRDGGTAPTENGSEILPCKAFPDMSSKDEQKQVIKSHTSQQQIQKPSPEPKETNQSCGSKEQPLCVAASEMSEIETGPISDNNGNEVSTVMDVQPKFIGHFSSETETPRPCDKSLTDEGLERTSHEKIVPVNEEGIQRMSEEDISILDSDVCRGCPEFTKKMNLESINLRKKADEDPGKPQCPTKVGEGAQPKNKFFSTPLEQSESNFAADVSKSERQKYTRLWYLIYKHMVSGSATEDGSKPLQNGEDKEIQGDDAKEFYRKNNADCQGSFAAGQDMVENYMSSQNMECHNEIVKLVEEAIDEIPLPETQDDASDNQSVAGDTILEQEFPEKKHGEEEAKFISSSAEPATQNSEEAESKTLALRSTLNSEEKILKSKAVSTQNEAKSKAEEGSISNKRVHRNWSNLKKLILLRRFVKVLERVREFNPRGPRYLPLDPARESEKVLLRHQNMEDRKNAEEWMLDHALQQVVAKLTPERKRRVGLLVEAFETVIPTIS